jgi:hypothetical protein
LASEKEREAPVGSGVHWAAARERRRVRRNRTEEAMKEENKD